MHRARIASLCSTLLVLTSCGPTEQEAAPSEKEELGVVEAEGREQQGREQQGREQQGREQQGSTFRLIYASRMNASLLGLGFSYVWVEGTKLFARFAHNGAVVSGSQLRGAELDAYDDAGLKKRLRIDSAPGSWRMDVDSASLMHLSSHRRNNEEIHLYKVKFYDSLIGQWRTLCPAKLNPDGTAAPESEMAIFTSFTFTGERYGGISEGYEEQGTGGSAKFGVLCWNGVAAKCLRWGYLPWKSLTPSGGSQAYSLKPYYEACVRAAMADYCGNGVSYTQEGTWIELWDNRGFIRKVSESAEPGFSAESAWNRDGARCLEKSRYDALPAYASDCPNREYWIPPGEPGNPTTKPLKFVLSPFNEGARSSCTDPAQYVFVDSSTYCPHSPTTTGAALAKDCSAATARVCNTRGCSYCCNKADSRGWNRGCAAEAQGAVVGSCEELVLNPSP